jgi:desulfoferrodoxin-like iron-binding protein
MNRRDTILAGMAIAAAGIIGSRAYGEEPEVKTVEMDGGWLTAKDGDKHIPVVEVKREGERADITIAVLHPQGKSHHISAIRLYDDDRVLISTVELDATRSEPRAVFSLKVAAGTALFAVSDCNLHGLWVKAFTA